MTANAGPATETEESHAILEPAVDVPPLNP
jgi:hypothetical protein